MKLLVITRPDFFEGEAQAIDLLFRCGLDTLHLRKPSAPVAEVAQLLAEIPARWHSRIMLHDVDLTSRFAVQGLHLNARRPQPPAGYQGCLSASCHSIDELRTRRDAVSYCLLSPIYDSLSKRGYCSHYTIAELQRAHAEGLIDGRVVAMGGITLSHLPQLSSLGFGGVALLGDVWGRLHDADDFHTHFSALRAATASLP
jgi:thiamine-phosphate pyrophosphorylase